VGFSLSFSLTLWTRGLGSRYPTKLHRKSGFWGTRHWLKRWLKLWWGFAHLFRPTYPDFLHEAPPAPSCAAFIKESRMKFANARKLHRKSGVRWGERGAPVQYRWNFDRVTGYLPSSSMSSSAAKPCRSFSPVYVQLPFGSYFFQRPVTVQFASDSCSVPVELQSSLGPIEVRLVFSSHP
jgi:hypothetical protein